MTVLARFAEQLAGLSPNAGDGELAEAARLRLYDTLGATAIGLTLEDGRRLRAIARSAGADAGWAETLRLHVAATRATEVDDINIAACATVGSVVAPVAVNLAAAWTLDDRTVLLAVAAGYEAMVGLGAAIGGAAILYKGVWPTYVTAPFAAAATTARLLQLDPARTANALALALARTTPLVGSAFSGPSPRWWLLGCAAAEGVNAARAAAAGLTGDPGLLEAFASAIGASLDAEALLDGPGVGRRILEIDTKPYPTSRQGLAAIEAFRALTPLTRPATEIERIEVFVPADYRGMVGRTEPPDERIGSLTSVAYQMALAALAPERLDDVGRANLFRSPAVDALLAKTTVHEDPRLTELFPRQWAGRVAITWRSGEVEAAEVREPDGCASRPFGWNALERKFHRLFAAAGLDRQGVQALARACSTLDGIAGVRETGGLPALVEAIASGPYEPVSAPSR